MKAIQYIGSKAEKRDNVAGTNLVWKQGQTLVVADDGAAARLAGHPRVWREDSGEAATALLSGAAAAVAVAPQSSGSAAPSADTNQPSTDPGQYKAGVPETPGAVHVPTPNFDSMTKADLVAYGQAEFRENIDSSQKKDDIVKRLIDLHAERTARDAAEGQGV